MKNIVYQKNIWSNKPILREVYKDILYRMTNYTLPGLILEIGSGGININNEKNSIIYTDIQKVPWLDVVSDAHKLPFAKNAFTNIFMIDVLHHLHSPVLFFEEAGKVLQKGGRIIIVEPAITIISKFFYKYCHSEPVDMHVNVFEEKLTTSDPFDSNQAIATLLFENFQKFENSVSNFKILKKKEFGILSYPLSGGYRNWSLLPMFLYPLIKRIEIYLERLLARYMGFRTLIVLEKK